MKYNKSTAFIFSFLLLISTVSAIDWNPFKTTGKVVSENDANGNFVLGGSNSWVIHTPDDGRSSLYIAPKKSDGTWDWANQLQIDADGKVTAKRICFQDGTCLSSASGMNSASGCVFGSQRCSADGMSVQVCVSSTTWESSSCDAGKVCQMQGSAAICITQNTSTQNNTNNNGGTNSPLICIPQQKLCDGENLKTCNAQGTAWNESVCSNGCHSSQWLGDMTRCNTLCRPGANLCDGNNQVSCNERGDDYSLLNNCGERGCNAATNSCYPECSPGKTRCVPGNIGVMQTCNAEGRWGGEETCSAGQTCKDLNGLASCETRSCGIRGVGGGLTCSQRCNQDPEIKQCVSGSFWNWFSTKQVGCDVPMPFYGGNCECCNI